MKIIKKFINFIFSTKKKSQEQIVFVSSNQIVLNTTKGIKIHKFDGTKWSQLQR